MFGQQNQQQTSGNVFGAAPQFGQSTGGFSFGAGSNTGAAASSTGGFSFSTTTQQKPAPTGFSLGASSSLATGTPGTTGGFSFGATPAAQATGFKFGGTTSGGFSFSTPTAVTTAPTSTVQTGGLAFGSGTSTGLNFGTAVTQQGSSGFKLGSTGTSGLNFGSPASTTAPGTGGLVLGGTAVTTASSPFTLGKPTASTGPTSGFTLGGTAGQPSGVLGSGTGGLTGSTLSQGFAFGANKTTAPATVTPTPAFSFGGSTASTRSASTGLSFSTSSEGSAPSLGISLGSGQKTSVAGGLNLGGTNFPSTGTTVAATSAGTGLSFGSVAPAISAATPFSSSFSGLAKTTAAPATVTLSTGIFGGKLPTASTTATPATGTLSPGIFGGKLPTASTTATTTAAGFPGLGGNKFGTTTTTAAGFPGLGGIKFGTTTTTATSLTTAATTVAARLGTAASTTSASSSSATTSVASSVPQLTYRQLEELINKWTVELTDFEKTFLDQAAQVNAWDRLLMENGEKITDLNASVENVKAEQERLDQELDFIMAQQKELEEMLKPLEEAANISNAGSRQLLQADKERDVTYKLANDIDGQLKQMVQDLKSIIDHLNTANTQQQDSDDPIRQIAKILNAHMNSLQWIDQNSGILQRKVDEISRLSETRRKEQERNFRLAFD